MRKAIEDMLNKKPMILVFAGPNGSGKSTITQYFDKVGTYTNADDIVAATGMSNKDAAVFADKKRYEAIEAKVDFTFETVLSSHYKLDILRKAKENGYFIKCIFVLTNDPMVNISRVDKIISRYYKSLANIKLLIELCDILHVYDNTVEPIRIIRKHKEDISIYSNEFWSEEEILQLLQ